MGTIIYIFKIVTAWIFQFETDEYSNKQLSTVCIQFDFVNWISDDDRVMWFEPEGEQFNQPGPAVHHMKGQVIEQVIALTPTFIKQGITCKLQNLTRSGIGCIKMLRK